MYNKFQGGKQMSIKEKIKEEIEELPESILKEVYDFIQFLEIKKTGKWSTFAFESGAFDFWRESEEVDYTLDDFKQRK
jgi:hypothetical protein